MAFFSTPARDAATAVVELKAPLFIADLHLSEARPDDVAGFFALLDAIETQPRFRDIKELVILGDFFDYWIGDDAAFTVKSIAGRLAAFARHRRVFFMHGNRDFLVGGAFARDTGMTLLTDPCVATIDNKRVLLSHGDLWCTDDTDYQNVRKRLRAGWWQWLALHLPLKKRLSLAENAREKSRTQKARKDVRQMDVVNDAVIRDARRLACPTVIHGHTHRPQIVDMGQGIIRAVLPDWHYKGTQPERGGFITLIDGVPVIHELTDITDKAD